MNQTASSVVTDGIALITLDNPPVNALSAPCGKHCSLNSIGRSAMIRCMRSC